MDSSSCGAPIAMPRCVDAKHLCNKSNEKYSLLTLLIFRFSFPAIRYLSHKMFRTIHILIDINIIYLDNNNNISLAREM